VDAWFKDFDHPLKDAMLRAREIILASDSRITECIKWKTPTFTYKGNLASFNPRSKKHVSILFHTGAHIPGSHPQLGGGAGTARYMALPTITDVEAARKDIAAVVKAWCDWKSAE
jgi:hypothetical protein